ncbi:MAG TPA: 50S ribosomal protein L22 [Bacilli bacterium]|mgnify:FL=1|nr:MAG: 50S ribosomal protein L22 [Tenericutes bacterium ADurb.BinA124]HNZ50356.1 50S ribosomal protein L22 [Bacilli bacterium]HOH18473.1 50S ribosomal protein L22 [Bacilli bacterium]HPN60702.1 50S ribosomal protein L22 [Bacilli bacterium]HPX84074.1 50S ribosomal protein L22 [Bacilli bacterium]
MEAKAIAKVVRIAPRKVRLVIDLVRGKKLAEANAILRLTPKAASRVVEKVIKSAAANAVNNYKLDQGKLFVKEAYVNEGPTMKRFLPRAKGSASAILKRTSHITVVLAEKE